MVPKQGRAMILKKSPRLIAHCESSSAGRLWLEQLPDAVAALAQRWSLTLGAPFEHSDVGCSWVAPATRTDGTAAILKVALRHFEGEHEIEGLRFWGGDGMVRLLEAEESLGALLLERCEPGTTLRTLPEPEQDVVIASLLRRLWRPAPSSHPFRSLSEMLRRWREEIIARQEAWPDPVWTREALQLFEELSRPTPTDVLLVTDLHAGNVLRARREAWLAIDPKPFVGDATYDATQHLLNCRARLEADAEDTIRRFADRLEIDAQRLRWWTFARLGAEPGDAPSHENSAALARKLAP